LEWIDSYFPAMTQFGKQSILGLTKDHRCAAGGGKKATRPNLLTMH
jgi:hypothetical protein